jgi:hypothetical protein
VTEAPWSLRGEAVVVFCGRRRIILAERYTASPVGPYTLVGVARLTRVGLRPGLRFSRMVVDNHARLTAGRRNWGLPGELGTLSWATVGDETAVVWHDRGLEIRAVAHGGAFPLIAPGRLLQNRADGPVVVPTRSRGRARRARIDVAIADGPDLPDLAGSYSGLVITGLATQLRQARVPAGRIWSARAPAAAPDVATYRGPCPGQADQALTPLAVSPSPSALR